MLQIIDLLPHMFCNACKNITSSYRIHLFPICKLLPNFIRGINSKLLGFLGCCNKFDALKKQGQCKDWFSIGRNYFHPMAFLFKFLTRGLKDVIF